MKDSLHTRLRHLAGTFALCTALIGLVSCGGGGSAGGGGGIGGTGSPSTLGTLNVSLTDAPACGFDAVNVTVQKVRVHTNAVADDTDAGWSEILLNPSRRLNLLDLMNGVTTNLGQTALPTGKYTQLRLVLADNDSANPLANSVVPIGGMETALPSTAAMESGLKVKVDIDVVAERTTDVLLDLDACRSVVRRGNTGEYNLTPVLSVSSVVR